MSFGHSGKFAIIDAGFKATQITCPLGHSQKGRKNMTPLITHEKCTSPRTVLTLYKEVDSHRLLYTLRSHPIPHTASRTFSLTVECLFQEKITDSTLEAFTSAEDYAIAITHLMAVNLVFPEHLVNVWEDLEKED